MKTQATFDIIRACSETDEADVMFECFLQSGVKQQEVATWNIVFKTESGCKLELIIADDCAAARQFSIFVDFNPRTIDHGKVFQQTTHPRVGSGTMPDRNVPDELQRRIDIRNGLMFRER